MFNLNPVYEEIESFAKESGRSADWVDDQKRYFEDAFWRIVEKWNGVPDEEWSDSVFWATLDNDDDLDWSFDDQDWRRRERAKTLKLPLVWGRVEYEPLEDDDEYDEE